MKSFLTHRTLYNIHNNVKPVKQQIRYGILQSVLRLLLFIINLINLPDYINCAVSFLYTDDTTFVVNNIHNNRIDEISQKALLECNKYFIANLLCSNKNKIK